MSSIVLYARTSAAGQVAYRRTQNSIADISGWESNKILQHLPWHKQNVVYNATEIEVYVENMNDHTIKSVLFTKTWKTLMSINNLIR